MNGDFIKSKSYCVFLTHWGQVTHKCVGNPAIIGPDNGLSPGRRQAIIWINAGILLIGPWGTNFSEILIGIHTFSFKKIHLKMSSGKCRPPCLGLNVLIGDQSHLPGDSLYESYLGDIHPCLTLHPLSIIGSYPDNIRPRGYRSVVIFTWDVMAWMLFQYWPFMRVISHRWEPLTKASNPEIWCFLYNKPE